MFRNNMTVAVLLTLIVIAVVITFGVTLIGSETRSIEKMSALMPFGSDGCSLFPDTSVITNHDWCDCCFQHDVAYWRGGTEAQREQADQLLKQCVADKTGNNTLATLMYEGVRFGGSPYFRTWYRWGYGWRNDRHYKPLSATEVELTDRLMLDYQNSDSSSVCGASLFDDWLD